MKKFLLILFFVTLSSKVVSQNWSPGEKDQTQKLELAAAVSPVFVYGEIDHSELGIKGPGIRPYGVPGGGIETALAMMLTHGFLLRSQQKEQFERINAESLQFGSVLTGKLNGLSNVQLIQEAVSISFDSSRITVAPVDLKSESFSGYQVDYRFSVTRDYHGLILNISFAKKIPQKSIFDLVIYSSNSLPYADNESNEKYDIKKDMLSLMGEAVELFYHKDNLIKNKANTSATFRSLAGKKKVFERGFLIKQTCERHLFINLSDVWVAAPKLEPNTLDQCTPLASPPRVDPQKATLGSITL